MKNIDNILNKVRNRSAKPLGIRANFAILVPLIYIKGDIHVLYEIRSSSLKTQPGEVSFPGGGVEKNETFLQAAIRETEEELNISRKNIEIIGEMDYIMMPFNIGIYPYLGVLKEIDFNDIYYSTDEVQDIFTVPLDFLLENEPERYDMVIQPEVKNNFPFHLIRNGKAYDWRSGIYPVYFYKYKDYIIWGMTARMTKNFIDIIKQE